MILSMPWESFDKRAVPMTKRPQVTIQSKGILSCNGSCFEALGRPPAVELLFDREEQLIGIRPSDPESAIAYPMRPVGGGNTFLIAGTAFLNYYKVPFGSPVRYDANMVDGVLTIDLKQPGRDATSNRTRGRLLAEASNGHADDPLGRPLANGIGQVTRFEDEPVQTEIAEYD